MASPFLAQLDAAMAAGFGAASTWMRAPATLALAAEVCADLGVAQPPRVVLALLMMAADADGVLEADRDADAIMRREAERFDRALRAALGGGDAQGRGRARARRAPALAADAARAGRFYRAWLAQDRPHTLHSLMASVVASKARQRRDGVAAPAPPEETLAEIRRMAGAEAEAEARRRFDGAWEAVEGGAAGLARAVADVARRALWDVVAARAAEGDDEPLLAQVDELERALRALVAHAPRATEDLADKFSAAWIRERVAAGQLDAAALTGLMDYVAELVAAWEAPVDREDTAAWREEAAARLRAFAPDARERGRDECRDADADEEAARRAFMTDVVVPFVREAHGRVGRIWERVLALAEERAARDGAAAGGSAGDEKNARG